jgi:hypothetical protein
MSAASLATRAAQQYARSRFHAAQPPLPGSDMVAAGLAALAAGEVSDDALLVSIAAPRLRQLGIDVPVTLSRPEDQLFERLTQQHADAAHGRYNALVRRIVSFTRAAAPIARGADASVAIE